MAGAAAALAADLASDLETLAVTLLGPPAFTAGGQWRWRRKRGFALTVRGPHRGLWRDFETGQRGDALDLFAAVRGGCVLDAMRAASGFAGAPRAADRLPP